jgi:4-amino-4-deoxy-L-arabinose transferase-like glycosyltransferase
MSATKPYSSYLNHPIIKEFVTMTILFGVALLIRLPGLKHGFPLLLHPDEGVILDQVLFMTREGFWFAGNPGNFVRPNQILYLLNYVFLNIMSMIRFGENFAARYLINQQHFYHYARLLIASMGALIPPVAYQIGKLFKPNFALAAGLTFIAFPSYVLHSLYVTPDVPITLFTLLVIYFMLRYLHKNETLSLYFGILFAAVNTAEKYPGLISLSIVFAGILIKAFDHPTNPLSIKLRQAFRTSCLAILAFILALFLTAPKLFINSSMAVMGFLHSSRHEHLGADHLRFFGRLIFYIQSFASWSNILGIILIAAGCYALYKWYSKSMLLFFYGLVYWICLSVLSLHWERWALPMYLTPLFLISIGICFLWERYQHRPKIKWVVLALLTLYFGQQLITSIHIPIARASTDTRVAALDFCQANGITPENSLYEGYTPFQKRQKPITLLEASKNNPSDYAYVILSSMMFERVYQIPHNYPEEVQAYDQIRNTESLLTRIEPHPPANGVVDMIGDIAHYLGHRLKSTTYERYRGPIIEIYQVE